MHACNFITKLHTMLLPLFIFVWIIHITYVLPNFFLFHMHFPFVNLSWFILLLLDPLTSLPLFFNSFIFVYKVILSLYLPLILLYITTSLLFPNRPWPLTRPFLPFPLSFWYCPLLFIILILYVFLVFILIVLPFPILNWIDLASIFFALIPLSFCV